MIKQARITSLTNNFLTQVLPSLMAGAFAYEKKEMPNYLDFINRDALAKVKP